MPTGNDTQCHGVSALPCGERAVRCLTGEPIDRVPFGVGFMWQPWGDALDKWRAESGIADLEPTGYFGYDAAFAVPDLHCGIYPLYEYTVLEETDAFITYRDERGITKRDRRDGLSMPEFLDYPVKTADDWQRLKEERLRIDQPERLTEDWDAFRARLRQTGEAVQVGVYPWGVFGSVRDLMGVEALLYGFYEQPELIHDIMEHLTTLWLSIYARVAQEVQIDHIHIWEDMSGKQGSLISPRMVREFMMPCYDRIAEFADAVGARLMSVDTDGDCRELLAIMLGHGVNAFMPFEVQAGNDIVAYRQQYPGLGIMGGLDKRCLAGTRADVDREVDRAKETLRGGRYIPAFDHLIPPDARWENVFYAAKAIKALCYSKPN